MPRVVGYIKRFFSIMQLALNKFTRDDGPWLAAAMAYYASFSLFPLVLILVALLGFVLSLSPGARDAQAEVISLVARNGSPAMAYQLEQVLSGVKNEAGISGPIGVLVLLFAAGGIFAALDSAFDRLWNVPAPSTGGLIASIRLILFQRLNGFLMLLALGALVVVAFVGGLFLTGIDTYTQPVPAAHTGWQFFQVMLIVAVDTAVIATIYKVLPKPHVRWRDALPGALFAASVWEIGKFVLAALVISRNFSAYGVVGAFIALMAWIYYACVIFFVGAELVQVLCDGFPKAVAKAAAAEVELERAKVEREVAEHRAPGAIVTERIEGERRASRWASLRRASGGTLVGAAGLLFTVAAGGLYAVLHALRRR